MEYRLFRLGTLYQQKVFWKLKNIWKSYLLLHWDEAISNPPILTSENGEPEAKIALPPVHFCACSAVHSALEVGLESGKIIGGLSWNDVKNGEIKLKNHSIQRPKS